MPRYVALRSAARDPSSHSIRPTGDAATKSTDFPPSTNLKSLALSSPLAAVHLDFAPGTRPRVDVPDRRSPTIRHHNPRRHLSASTSAPELVLPHRCRRANSDITRGMCWCSPAFARADGFGTRIGHRGCRCSMYAQDRSPATNARGDTTSGRRPSRPRLLFCSRRTPCAHRAPRALHPRHEAIWPLQDESGVAQTLAARALRYSKSATRAQVVPRPRGRRPRLRPTPPLLSPSRPSLEDGPRLAGLHPAASRYVASRGVALRLAALRYVSRRCVTSRCVASPDASPGHLALRAATLQPHHAPARWRLTERSHGTPRERPATRPAVERTHYIPLHTVRRMYCN
ncbi:hypothetical protein B0H12DRAFT_1071970 [Mycena haematopus]|nr:hypothetical protein B0H12DRAFT_1071970 [Mycena haematopus]